jgi:hypothetical protein
MIRAPQWIGSRDWLLRTPRHYAFAVRCSQNTLLVHPSVCLLAAQYMQTQIPRHWSGFAQSRIRLNWRNPLPPLRHPAPACAGRASAAPAGFSRLCKRCRVPLGPGGRTRHATCPNPKESFTLKGLERFHLPPDAGRAALDGAVNGPATFLEPARRQSRIRRGYSSASIASRDDLASRLQYPPRPHPRGPKKKRGESE